jgi:hypothetical protein
MYEFICISVHLQLSKQQNCKQKKIWATIRRGQCRRRRGCHMARVSALPRALPSAYVPSTPRALPSAYALSGGRPRAAERMPRALVRRGEGRRRMLHLCRGLSRRRTAGEERPRKLPCVPIRRGHCRRRSDDAVCPSPSIHSATPTVSTPRATVQPSVLHLYAKG